ncbi:MAG: tetratricopeptide repeat protein [Bacteroidia bacterium]
MSTHKNIFKQQAPISEQEMKDYLAGKLSKEHQREVELKLQSSPLSEEAIEGFSEHPDALANITRLKTKVNLRTERLNYNKWNFKYTLAAASVVAITMLFLGKYFIFDKAEITLSKPLVAENLSKEDEKNTSEQIQNEINAIEEAEILPEIDQITSEQVADNTPITLHFEETQPAMAEAIEHELKQSLQMSSKKAESVRIAVPQEEEIVKSNMPTLYINGLLVIDYSDKYTEPTSASDLSGTPAKYNSLSDTVHEKTTTLETEQQFDYMDYLSLSLNKYKQDKYKAALKNFLLILNQYPEDLNAKFYGGLCYYNINNPTKAMEFFDYILTHDYNTFYQEAQFYKALCLNRMGEYGKANLLLQKIVAQNGFFAEQAKALLEKQK